MWNPFKKKPVLSDEDCFFQTATFKWLLKHYGGDEFYKETELILPTRDFFPEQVSSAEEVAESTFKYVKKYAGMEKWPCKLEAQEPDPERKLAPTLLVQGGENSPLGTFSANNPKEIKITYNPALTSNPSQLVATFAHELAHYLTATCPEPPPGGWENWEFATDIAAVFLGFGVFMANTAFNFMQYTDVDSQGWSSSRNGYLSEAEFSFSLAVFIKLKEIDPAGVFPYLDSSVKTFVKRSLNELNASNSYHELKSVKYVAINS